MPPLREIRGLRVAGVEGRRGIVRRENHERLEEADDRVLPLLRKRGKGLLRRLRLPTVAQNHFPEINAPAIVAIRRCVAHPPQWQGHELRRHEYR